MPAPEKVVPHELRAVVAEFTGREQELSRLCMRIKELTTAGKEAVAVITGPPGIGKTELAMRIGHELEQDFHDGQFLLELAGSSETPATPDEAMRQVIRTLSNAEVGQLSSRELKGKYNTLLSGKRILIVADDAGNAAQIRPLLPPSGCALLITSRKQLSLEGLSDEAVVILKTLSEPEAVQMLQTLCPRLGKAAAELAKLCGYLPLALSISAGLLISNQARGIREYLAELRDENHRLQELEAYDDPIRNVSASFTLSYRALSPELQAVFCQLGVFARSFDLEAAQEIVRLLPGASTGSSLNLDEWLKQLCHHNLVNWDSATQHYFLHDLVKLFAAKQLGHNDHETRLRHASYYCRLGRQADEAYIQGGLEQKNGLSSFDQNWSNIQVGQGWVVRQFQTNPHAAAELLVRYAEAIPNLLRLRQYPVIRRQWVESALQAIDYIQDDNERIALEGLLFNLLGDVYTDMGCLKQALKLYQKSLKRVRQTNDGLSESNVLDKLGIVYLTLGKPYKSLEYHAISLQLSYELNDWSAHVRSVVNLANVEAVLGNTSRVVEYLEHCLEAARSAKNLQVEAEALSNLSGAYYDAGQTQKALEAGNLSLKISTGLNYSRVTSNTYSNLARIQTRLGQYGEARNLCRNSLKIAYQIEDWRTIQDVLEVLGNLYYATGDYCKALNKYKQSLVVASKVPYPYGIARALSKLGSTWLALDNQAEARKYLSKALILFQKIGLPLQDLAEQNRVEVFDTQPDQSASVFEMLSLTCLVTDKGM